MYASPDWYAAHAETPLDDGSLADQDARIIACGDWTDGNRVEGALLAGLSAAAKITGELRAPRTSSQLDPRANGV